MGLASKLIKDKMGSTIRNLVKEKRLIFPNGEKVVYTNRQGVKKTISLDEMVRVLVDASGEEYLLRVGITSKDVKGMLSGESKKQKEASK